MIVDDHPRRISVEAASYVQSQMPLLTSIIMHRGVLRMIREIVTEDFPSGLTEPRDRGLPAGLEGHLCSEVCPFFRGGGHAASSVVDVSGLEPLEGGIGGGFGVDDESLMFPLLFGSAEF
jgi:hypothetical protein